MRFDEENMSALFSLEHGGRLSSLVIDGSEVLVNDETSRSTPQGWGSYPMLPWAGRVRRGRFDFDEKSYTLPLTPLGESHPPHAIHGIGYLQEWTQTDESTMELSFDERWPFGGSATQTVATTATSLQMSLTVTAASVAMPVMVGWHPWFRRQLREDGPSAQLDWTPGPMYELDAEAIPTGDKVTATTGPWDNCFVAEHAPPVLRWGNELALKVESDCSHWVVYTQPDHALCVEPQSAAPDVFNRVSPRLEPGQSMSRFIRLSWGPDSGIRSGRSS